MSRDTQVADVDHEPLEMTHWLFRARISTDGVVDFYEHHTVVSAQCLWRLNDPGFDAGGGWITERYSPYRWLVPKPKFVTVHTALIAFRRDSVRSWNGASDAEYRARIYAMAMAGRILGPKRELAKLNRRADGYFHCPHCGNRFATLAPFANHLRFDHGDSGRWSHVQNDGRFWRVNRSSRAAWLKLKKA